MRDREDKFYVYHQVKKIWNGIVSIGDYTLDKCLRKRKGLVLQLFGETMTIL